ncbi:sugar-binding transcriptional regulator, partial [Lentibacillus halophilus]
LSGEVDCLFVPARGGIGEKEEHQANTIAAKMARQAHGNYRLLYVPDPLSETSYRTMIEEPAVQDVLHLMYEADVVLHGIGDALTMAERRKTPEDILQKLRDGHAVSEAFGYYFNAFGEIVHHVRTIGIHLDDLSENSKRVITVAGGESKAQAIESYFKQGKSDLLITDEAAAEAILEG